MKYCSNCILPDTRPNLVIESDGVCNACKYSKRKVDNIDWDKRENNFKQIVEEAKLNSKGYDCLIPVSGGKDSTWQVVKCLEYGLNPLAVTWKTPVRTEIGQKNLSNLIDLGVDHIDYQINPNVERKFLYRALVDYGATGIPMHMAMFNISFTVAFKFGIPLVIWGEDSASEYGSSSEKRTGFRLDSDWLKKYGVTHGTTASDWISEDLSRKELTPYFAPSDKDLEKSEVSAIFLGYFFPWDPEISLKVAKANGFQEDTKGPRTGYYNYADIDDYFISIHHYFKWYKFGFTRLFDNLSIEIRNNRLSREAAIEIVKNVGIQRPEDDIKKFCEFVGITEEIFYEIIEKFRDKNIWHKKEGKWVIPNFLINDWDWNEF